MMTISLFIMSDTCKLKQNRVTVSAHPHLGMKSVLFRNDEISPGTVLYGVEVFSVGSLADNAGAGN